MPTLTITRLQTAALTMCGLLLALPLYLCFVPMSGPDVLMRVTGAHAPASPAHSVASAASQPGSPGGEDRPKRSMSRSGSTRMLSSFDNLQGLSVSPAVLLPN